MKRLDSRLTYANVVATICLFLLVGGGAAFAASKLAKNSVGNKQLKKNAVTTAKIKDGAVTTAKLANGAVNGDKVADNSLTGADINQATLSSVRASNVLAFSLDGKCGPASPFPAGVAVEHTSEGVCKFTFSSSVASCSANGTVHLRLKPNEIGIAEPRTVQVSNVSDTPNILVTSTYANNSKADLPFDLTMVC